MNVTIELNDENGHPVLILNNCHQPELVCIKTLNVGSGNAIVNIEDLRLAIRKLTVK